MVDGGARGKRPASDLPPMPALEAGFFMPGDPMSFTSPAIWRSTTIFAGGRRVYETLARLTFTLPDGRRFTVPAGFLTDLASVPSIARGLFAPDGPWAESAISV